MIMKEMEAEVQEVLDREFWRGSASGKIEGALNVLYALDLPKERRIELLADAVGLTIGTATKILEPREIEKNIYALEDMPPAEKNALLSLMENEAMQSEEVMEYPKQTVRLIAAIDGGRFIEECLPQVDAWVEAGEDVTMSKVRNWIIEKYHLL